MNYINRVFLFKNSFYDKIIIFSFSVFIFFFDFLREYIDFRLIIFIPFFFFIYEIYSKKKLISKYYLLFLLILLFLILQAQAQNIDLPNKIYSFKSIIFLAVTASSIWYFSDKILKNLNFIFNFFLVFLFFYIIFFTIYRYDIHVQHDQCYIGCFSILNDNLKFFKENSHIGFISSTLIAYILINLKKNNLYILPLALFYLLIFLNFSLTIFISIIISLSYFLIFYYKSFNLYQKIFIIFLLISSIYKINVNSGAIDKIYNLIQINNWKVNENLIFSDNINNNKINDEDKNKVEKNINNPEPINKENSQKRKNLSSEVYIVSFNIAKQSILEKPFGYGFNNYHLAFKKYIDKMYVTNPLTKKLNVFDGSNNFAKLAAELGIFSIFIFYILLRFLFSKNIPFQYKFIIFPALFSQTIIRGAGYFNGGYILFLVLTCYLLYRPNKKN